MVMRSLFLFHAPGVFLLKGENMPALILFVVGVIITIACFYIYEV